MREDLDKVIVERERRGKRTSKKLGLRIRDADPETEHDGPSRASFSVNKQDLGWYTKEQTDVLRPLRGLLRKNVGRPWNKFFSELCARFDRRTVTGRHIFQHLEFEVTTKCTLDGRRVMSVVEGRRSSQSREVTGYYVHPKTGLLRYIPRRPGK